MLHIGFSLPTPTSPPPPAPEHYPLNGGTQNSLGINLHFISHSS